MPEAIKAFISYQRQDRVLAERISRRLRRYVPPRASGLGGQRIAVVRDEERFIGGPDLKEMLRQEAQAVDKLVLLCSSASADSPYVNLEVEAFCEYRGLNDVIFVLVDGEFPQVLPAALAAVVDVPAYIDMQSSDRKSFRLQSLRLVATIHAINFDRLWRVDDEYRRHRRAMSVAAVSLSALVLGSAYLVASTPADAWVNIPQPDAREQFAFRDGVLPVHDVAISRKDPALILYRGRNPAWPDGPLPPTFHVEPEDGSSQFLTKSAELVAGESVLPDPAASIEFSIEVLGLRVAEGNVRIQIAREGSGAARFLRSARLDMSGPDTSPGLITLDRVLLSRQESNPLDIGFAIDALVRANPQIERHDEFVVFGRIDDGVLGTSYETEFTVESAIDPYDSWVDFLDEPEKIFGSQPSGSIVVGGTTLDAVEHDPDTWSKIAESPQWATYEPNKVTHIGSFYEDDVIWTDGAPLPGEPVLEIFRRIQETVDPAALAVLALKDWPADFYTEVTHYAAPGLAPGRRAELIELRGIQDRQGDGFHPAGSRSWLVRIGEARWRPLRLPSNRLIGIWPLGHGDAIVLTEDQGFLRSRDSGQSWADGNYNETGFTAGSSVKPIVVSGSRSTFALIARGSRADPENPLLRLTRRGWFDRWRFGLARLLGGDTVDNE